VSKNGRENIQGWLFQISGLQRFAAFWCRRDVFQTAQLIFNNINVVVKIQCNDDHLK